MEKLEFTFTEAEELRNAILEQLEIARKAQNKVFRMFTAYMSQPECAIFKEGERLRVGWTRISNAMLAKEHVLEILESFDIHVVSIESSLLSPTAKVIFINKDIAPVEEGLEPPEYMLVYHQTRTEPDGRPHIDDIEIQKILYDQK